MKKSEIQKLRNKSIKSLEKELQDAKGKLSDLQFNLSVGKVKNVRNIREIKKKIARIMTLIREKELNKNN